MLVYACVHTILVYAQVCINYARVYMYMYALICLCIHMCTQYMYVHKYALTCLCMHVYAKIYTLINMLVYAHSTCICTSVHASLHPTQVRVCVLKKTLISFLVQLALQTTIMCFPHSPKYVY